MRGIAVDAGAIRRGIVVDAGTTGRGNAAPQGGELLTIPAP